MEAFESKTESLLLSVLEVAAVLRRPDGSIFSSKAFKLYQVYTWISLSTLFTCCSFFVLNEEGNKLQTLFMGSCALQFLACNLLLIFKTKNILEMQHISAEAFRQLTPNKENCGKMEFVYKKSHMFVKSFAFLVCMNIITGIVQGLLKTWLSGQTSFPFPVSCLGLPTVPCWFVQVFSTSQAAFYISAQLSILKIIVYRLQGYADILSNAIRDRPVYDDKENDRAILKLYCDFSRFAASLSNIFGITSFVEVAFTSVRSCFQTYHVVTAISNNDWENASGSIVAFASSIAATYIVCSCGEDMDVMNNSLRNGFLESKWYECSPQSRKRLLPILVLNRAPIRFHYREYMHFNMEKLMQVLQSTYSLTTALANFI